jgi:ABC-type sugar transport system ATPase subunit
MTGVVETREAGAGAAEPYVAARGISKRFAHVVALQGIDLDVYEGEILALVGDNGAGKSTLIKIAQVLARPG